LRGDVPDPELLRYLRPYYELAFWGKYELGVAGATAAAPAGVPSGHAHPHLKELLEIAWEATHGRRYEKPAEFNPTLVLFLCRGRGYFLLDAPQFDGRCYALDGLKPEAVASAGPDQQLPPLPLDLLNDLRQLDGQLAKRHEADRKLILRWADPCHRVGYGYTVEQPSAREPSSTGYQLSGQLFPFELDWAIKKERCRRDQNEPAFTPLPRWTVPVASAE
jgi:hypothetical protein